MSLCTLCVSLMGHCRHLSRLSLRVLSVTTVSSNRCSCAKQTSRGRRAGVHEPSPSIGSTCDSGTLRSDCGESKGQVVGLRGWARFDSRSAPGKILIKSSLARAARALCDTLSSAKTKSVKEKGWKTISFPGFPGSSSVLGSNAVYKYVLFRIAVLRGVGCLVATACRRQGCVLQTASKLCEGGKCAVAAVAQTLRGQQRASDFSNTKCPRDTGS